MGRVLLQMVHGRQCGVWPWRAEEALGEHRQARVNPRGGQCSDSKQMKATWPSLTWLNDSSSSVHERWWE